MQRMHGCARGALLLLAILVAGSVTTLPAAAPPKPSMPFDEYMCKCAGLLTDPVSLIGYLKERIAEKDEAPKIRALVEQLGHEDFAQREEAGKRLEELGVRAADILDRNARHDNFEIRRRVARLRLKLGSRRAIGHDLTAPLSRSVVALLARSGHPDAVETLLRYVPSADCEETLEELYYSLDGLVDLKRLIKAASDEEPSVRALAACLLGKSHPGRLLGPGVFLKGPAAMLADADAMVRLRAAQGLLAANKPHRAALPVLIALLEGTPLVIAWQAEELLRYAASGKSPPKEMIGNGDPKVRAACVAAWRAWEKRYAADIDLSGIHESGRSPRLLMVVEQEWRYENPHDHKSWEYKCLLSKRYLLGGEGEHRGEWEHPRLATLTASSPTGEVLIFSGLPAKEFEQGKGWVEKRTPEGALCWKHEVAGAYRLARNNSLGYSVGLWMQPGGGWLLWSNELVVRFNESGREMRRATREKKVGMELTRLAPEGLLYGLPEVGWGGPVMPYSPPASLPGEKPVKPRQFIDVYRADVWTGRFQNEPIWFPGIPAWHKDIWPFVALPTGQFYALVNTDWPREKLVMVCFDREGREVGKLPVLAQPVAALRNGNLLAKLPENRVGELSPTGLVWQTRKYPGSVIVVPFCPLIRFGFGPAR
jgi:hypothetical protein